MQSIAKDLGFYVSICMHSDACAAIGIARRRGLGKIRHLDVEDLWVQQIIRDRGVDLVKVLGAENPADILTEYVAAEYTQQDASKERYGVLGWTSLSSPRTT